MKFNSTIVGIIIPILLVSFQPVFSQTSLSGSQSYTQTLASSFDDPSASIDVVSSTGFAIADKILIIQMKGAIIDLTNTGNFGLVNNYNGAGSFETGIICDISGNTITMDRFLTNSYDEGGSVQIIKVPVYTDVTIDGILTAPAWDGTFGGVLVLEANQVTLNANIDMTGKGFRGGQFNNSNFNCNFLSLRPDYFYTSSDDGGEKGEGIAAYTPAYQFGKGALANGGGGGNDHNSGGAGGANVTPGGLGGNNGETGTFNCKGVHAGIGGKAQTITNRIYLGGGGGAGHGNNNVGTSGANGGGIIIISAGIFVGNGHSVIADGNDGLQTTGGDGGGGGGAGGSVYIDCENFQTNVTVSLNGGNGSDVRDSTGPRCWGPGGGGSGGHLKLRGLIPGVMTTSMNGGQPGTNIHTNSNCTGSTSGATAGTGGQMLTNAGIIPVGLVDYLDCNLVLPAELISFTAIPVQKTVKLKWTTGTEIDTDYFVIERSKNGVDFEEVSFVQAAGNSNEHIDYEFLHRTPWPGKSYYRLKQVDLNGEFEYSELRQVLFNRGVAIYSLFPNPAKNSETVVLEVAAIVNTTSTLNVFSILGHLVLSKEIALEEGYNTISLNAKLFGQGNYIVQLQTGTNAITRKLTIY